MYIRLWVFQSFFRDENIFLVSLVYSHPCKKRKDGAPFVQVGREKAKSAKR